MLRPVALKHYSVEHQDASELTTMKTQRDLAIQTRRGVRMSCCGASCRVTRVRGASGLLFLLKGWAAASKLVRATRQVKVLSKQYREHMNEMRRCELNSAYRRRDLANAYKLARMISGTREGAQRKGGRLPMAARPSRVQYLSKLSLPGAAGGWGASEVHASPLTACEASDCYVSFEHWAQAGADLKAMSTLAVHASNRKSVPGWEVPSAIWRMILRPDDVSTRLRVGIGAFRSFSSPSCFLELVTWLLVIIRASNALPAQFSYSVGHCVPKKCHARLGVEETFTDDSRIVHRFGALPKLFLKHVYQARADVTPPGNAYCAVRARRREHAIAVQAITGYKLRACGFNSILALYDITHAFNSPSLESCEQAFRNNSSKRCV